MLNEDVNEIVLSKGKNLLQKYYFNNYVDFDRFISYFYQIDSILKLNPKSVLEVGVGNKTVYNYLKQSGLNMVSCDFNRNLNPDKVGDIRNLPFEDNEFDVVLAYEVLEHIPFEDFSVALSELRRVSKKYVIISIPYPGFFAEIVLNSNLPLLKKIYNPIFKIPFFLHEHKETEDHFWEMGRKNVSKKKIRNLIKENFKITDEIRPVLNSYHCFFILEKKWWPILERPS